MKYLYLAIAIVFYGICLPAATPGAVHLAIETNESFVKPGERIKISLKAANSGNSELTDVELHLTYPKYLETTQTPTINTGGVENTVHCEPGIKNYCISGNTVVWRLGALSAGEGVSLDLRPVVAKATDGSQILLDAELRVDGSTVASAGRVLTVQSTTSFDLTIDTDQGLSDPDGQIEYRMNYSAFGTVLSEPKLSFPVPAGTTYVSSSEGGRVVDNTVVWDIDDLAGNICTERRVTVLAGGLPGELVEVDSVVLSGTDPYYNVMEIQSSRAVHLADQRPLDLALMVNPSAVRPSEKLDVSLIVANKGESEFENVELRLRYPNHLLTTQTGTISTGGSANTVYCDPGQKNYCKAGDVVVWQLGTLAAGKTISVDMRPAVGDVADGTLIQFEAELRVNGKQANQVSRTVSVQSVPSFDLVVKENSAPVDRSGEVEFNIHYTKFGQTLSNMQLSFPIPKTANYVSSTDGGQLVNNTVVWTLDGLLNDIAETRRVVLRTTGAPGYLLKVDPVVISGTDANYIAHEVRANRVVPLADTVPGGLVIAATPFVLQKPGSGKVETIHLSLTAVNQGTSNLANVELHLRYPEHLQTTNTDTINTGGSANTVSCAHPDYCVNGDFVVWHLGTLPPGEGVTVAMISTLRDKIIDGELIEITAELRAAGTPVVRANKTVSFQSDPGFDMTIDSSGPVEADGKAAYTIHYSRSGTPLSGQKLTFPLPKGTGFISSTKNGVQVGNTVVWDLETLETKQAENCRVVLSTDKADGDFLWIDPVVLSGTDSNYQMRQYQGHQVNRVGKPPGAGFGMTVSPSIIKPGERADVSLMVTNPGTSVLRNVELWLEYPVNLAMTSTWDICPGTGSGTVTCGGDYICTPGEYVVWNLGAILPGEGIKVGLLPQVISYTDGALIQFRAELRIQGRQVARTSRTIAVQASPPFDLSIDAALDPVDAQETLEYRISYSRFDNNLSGIQLLFPLPVGTRYLSSTDGGTLINDQVVWDLTDLDKNMSGECRVKLAVTGSHGALVMADRVTLLGVDASGRSHAVQASRMGRIGKTDGLHLGMMVNPMLIRPGTGSSISFQNETLNLALTVTNPDNRALSNVEVLLKYPEHLDRMSPSAINTGNAASSVTCLNATDLPVPCMPGSIARWNLGTIPPKGGVTVNMMPHVAAGMVDGTLIPLEAELWINGRQKVMASRTVAMKSPPMLELTIDRDTDPRPGENITDVRLHYSNIGADVTNAQLTLPLPEGTIFIAATDEGTFNDGIITWNLGTLPAGSGGEVYVKILVHGMPANLFEIDRACLTASNADNHTQKVYASQVSRFKNRESPKLDIDLTPLHVVPDGELNSTVTITNSGSTALLNAELLFRYQGRVESLISFSPGTYSNGILTVRGKGVWEEFYYYYTGNNPTIIWDMGTLAPGEIKTITIPSKVRYGTPPGFQVKLDAELRVNGIQVAKISKSAMAGSLFKPATLFPVCGDVDNDGLVDLKDLMFALKALAGMGYPFFAGGDCNNDMVIDMQEALKILHQQ